MNDSHGSHPRTHYTTGQAIVIIAMGFVILLGFTGLVVDVARVFTARAQLRRAVDAAGLAAAAQFRLHATQADINNAATELMYAHDIVSDTNTFSGMAVTSLTVQTCDTDPGDTSLCTTPLRRKLVRVTAEANVSMLFLQLLGIPTVSIAAESLSEAAAVDVVLVIDSSESQAYDAPSMQAYNGRSDLSCDPTSFGVIGQDYGLNVNACTLACNDDPSHPCYPFQQVKDAAKDFIDNLYEPYDRGAVVRFDG